jgi:hypothetical protein
MRRNFLGLLILTWALMHRSLAQSAPTIVSTVPLNGASGVSTSAPVVFTFSETMDTDNTDVIFYDSAFNFYTPTAAWSANDTVLTYPPSPAFPANTMINWVVSGQNPAGDPIGGIPIGSFTTGSGGGGGGSGSGTNAITTFSVGKLHSYTQTSTALPTLDSDPYSFLAVTGLASNRTATSVALTLPTTAVSNLNQIPGHPESFILVGFTNNLTTFDNTFPAGNYSFFVQAASSNQTVVVDLPVSMAQPGAPHLTNYPATQAVDPSQAFVLGWDPFSGGTSADYISVDIGTAYSSTNVGSVGALNGTAVAFTIPAGKLQPNTNYASTISFYHLLSVTNGTSYATTAFRSTTTAFTLITTGGATGGPLVLTNASWAPGNFIFDVLCTNGQTVTVEFTNVLSAGAWPKLLTTNSPGSRVHIVSPQTGSYPSLYFRARNGP